LAPGAAAALAPATEPLAVLVEDGGTTLFRADLAPGALVASPGGKGFSYRDRRGAAGPLRSLRLQLRAGTFKWSLRASGLTLAPAMPAQLELRLIVGDDCSRAIVPCVAGATTTVCR